MRHIHAARSFQHEAQSVRRAARSVERDKGPFLTFIRGLTYPVDQPGWLSELLLAVVLAAIPIFGYFVIKGWEFEISSRVYHGAPKLFPGWGQLGRKFQRGLIIRLTGILYNIPTYLLAGITIWLWIAPIVKVIQGKTDWSVQIIDLYADGRFGLRLGMLIVTLIVGFLMNSLYWAGYLRYIQMQRYSFFYDLVYNFQVVVLTMLDDFIMGIHLALGTAIAGMLDTIFGGALAATGIGAFLAPLILPAITFTFMSSLTGYLFGIMAIRSFKDEDAEPKQVYENQRAAAPLRKPPRA